MSTALGGALKCRATPSMYGSRLKKSKSSAAATKREEAATKANRFQKAVKQPQMVSV